MIFVTLSTTAAQTRYFYDSGSKEHKQEVVSTLLYFRLLWGAVVVGICMLAASTFNQLIFKGEVPNTYFYLVFLSALFSAILSCIVEVYRLLLRPKSYLALTLSHSLLGTCLIILLVVYFKQGVMGYLVGYAVSILVIVPVAIFLLRDYIRPKFSRPLLAKSLKFCVPLLPNGIAIWIITFSDRYFLILYTTLGEVGLYAVGAKFGLAIGLITGSFRLAWTPLALSVAKEPDAKAFYRNVATIYLVGLSFITIVLTGLSKLLMIVMTQPDYYAGYTVIGILAYGAVFYGLYTISALGMWLSEKTVWGMLGAATATLCAYIVGNGLAFYFGEKCYHIGFNYLHLGATVLVTCLGIALQLMLLATNWSLPLQYGLILIIWATIGLFFTFKVIGRSRIESVMGAVRTYLKQDKK
jgi:O-antigen/teichoic acid export membrane protein